MMRSGAGYFGTTARASTAYPVRPRRSPATRPGRRRRDEMSAVPGLFASRFTRGGGAAALAAALAFVSATAEPAIGAETFPNRPIRMIVPNTAGSAQDIVARMVSQRLSES